jgi:cytoskeletal protein RodZ
VDAVDIIILAAAGVGLAAFVVLAVIILRQGRALKELEERIGPPVPPAAAPSLERVRAVRAQASARAEPPAEPAAAAPSTSDDGSPGSDAAPAPAPAEPRQTARQAAAAKAAEKEARRSRGRAEEAGAGDADDAAGRGLVLGAIAIVVIGLLGAGGWYLFIRDDGSGGSPTTAQSTTQASTGTTTTDSGIVPEDVPPLANKAAYTVAVLNASNVTGAAANKVAPRVQADGYTLGVVDNASKQGLTESQVQYVKGRKEVGWNLAKDLGITRAVEVDSLAQGRIGTADAVVIVGTDLAK